MVHGRYPLVSLGVVPGFTLRGRFGDLYLFEVTHRLEEPPLLRLDRGKKRG
jgi:hypothetical protein